MKLYLLFILVLIHTVSNAFAYECVYAQKTTKEEPYSEIFPQGDCVEIIVGDILKIKKSHFNRLHFSKDNLAWVIISDPPPKRVFYVSSKEKIVRTHFYDNGPDYFKEGLARTISDGRFGFIDRKLQVVIDAQYDFAFPFKNGYAVVCNQCKPETVGEHLKVSGGVWGLINKDGRVIIPINRQRDEFLKNKELSAIWGSKTQIE